MKLRKNSFLLIFIILSSLSTNAMNSNAILSNKSREFGFLLSDTSNDVKIPAEFPGGQKEWQNYLV